MKASEYKQVAQVLGLFANVRESAEPPESLIGVQVSDGVAKLIAGKGLARFGQGVVVTLDGAFSGKHAYTISARPFLQAAKVIGGKQEVEFDISDKGLTIVTSEGGKVFLKVEGDLREAGFPKKPREFKVESRIPAEAFTQLAKVFDTVHADYEIEAPSMEQVGNVSHFVVVQPAGRAMYGHFEAQGSGPDGYFASVYPQFWRSMRHLDAEGLIKWGEDGALAVSGPYELYSTPYRVSKYDSRTRRSEEPRNPDPWPIMSLSGAPSVSFTIDKKPLVEAVKGVMPHDEHGRVVLTVKEGYLNVAAFGQEGGMTVPAETLHDGNRACNAEYLLKLLRAIDGKSVTIGWAQQPAMILSAPEMKGWTILLAPIALNT